MRRYSLVAAVSLLASLAITGCASSGAKHTAAHGKPVNSVCPIGKDPVAEDATLLATHRGQTVAFCCEGCVEMWATWNDSQRDEALAAVMKK